MANRWVVVMSKNSDGKGMQGVERRAVNVKESDECEKVDESFSANLTGRLNI